MDYATCVIHVGLSGTWRGSGTRLQWWQRLCTAELTGMRVLATRMAYSLQHLTGEDVLLTEVLVRAELQRSVAGGTELGDGVDTGLLRASGSRGLTREALAEMLRGSGRSGDRRRRGIARAEHLTGGGPRCNSGATRVEVAGGELGELPGGEAELLQGLAGAGA
jgi:hypothetical protein